MKPSQIASALHWIAIGSKSGLPKAQVISSLRRVLASLGSFSGMTVQKADVKEFHPIDEENAHGIVEGDFVLTSPSGKKIEVSGRADGDNVDLTIYVDGKEIPIEGDVTLGILDPDGYPEESREASSTIDQVLLEIAKSQSAPAE